MRRKEHGADCKLERAETILKSISEEAEWSEVRDNLKSNLGPRDLAKESKTTLVTLRRGSKETLWQSAIRAQILSKQAFPGTNSEAQEREAINAFGQTLEVEIQAEVLKSRPKEVRKACDTAEEMMEIRQRLPPGIATIDNGSHNRMEIEVAALRQRITEMKCYDEFTGDINIYCIL